MANNNDNKVLNVPPLRFPEFTKEWEEHALAEYLDFKNGLNPDVKRIGRGLPFISVMDILADGTINYDSIRGKVEATEREIENFSVEKGDILFQRSSETLEDVGRANVYMDNRTAVYGGFVIRGRKIGDYNPLFFKYLLSTPLARKRTCRMGAGAQHFNIGQGGLSKISLCFPLMEEQNKIARLLSLIDERIATQNKIIDKLQSLIKGLRVCCMQRNGSNNVYLSEIAQIYQPQTISSAELTEDGFLVYGANGIIGKYKDYNHKTEQICITCRGNTCGMVNYTKPMSWITGNAMVINTDKYQDKVYKKYLYHYLSAYNFNSIISGSGQPQIVRTPLEKLKITLPTISEQKQKAMILDKIQDKIEINHNILNLYILQKQYLLRQMFI
ncbi:restriction endonuclease subunit S [Parabacteroides merdae]|uniref:restriction endonuclease subunit S n=1 Tax=Parabacteroides merdae TaxID=46503 RepID=UPI000EBB65AC|nr:restriction endonuclease subunit S [Parabacteroides merdae]MDB8943291.1 restriction endonuclease subunit S [Parabacteroides merdae]MTT23930.1 restriction endonuclease subunit S [Parabacteroides merdae]MTU51644.1 restriction endonuclease subunit S [Parabacteroides merdae]MTU63775.1 restriction endonuclease subunit S [Parabacteroides merdae]MTU74154.1 restriction endonuclease subunit S [Parabacteroides merdae]